MRPRTTWMRKMAAAAVVVAAASAGAMAAGAVGEPNGAGQVPPTPRAGVASPSESVFIPVTPCRIVNTQNPAGAFDAGEVREYRVQGNTSTQGGAVQCGIPTSATAVEMTITSVSAQGAGYLRVGPAGFSTPTATFLNYGPGQNLGNTGTVTVKPGSPVNLRVQAFQAATHVVIDVSGYYVKALHASVNASGTVVRGNGTVAASVKAGTGTYRVEFDRNVSGCAFSGVIGNASTGSPAPGFVVATPDASDIYRVYVQTFDAAVTLVDKPFHLTVTC